MINLVLILSIIVGNLLTVLSDTTSQIFGEEVLSHWDIYRSGPYGNVGRQGEFFNDFRQSLDGKYVRPTHWPDTINIRSGGSIDGIQIFYGTYKADNHGGLGGQLFKVRLYHGDRITKVTGRHGIGPGAEVDQLTFYTKNGKKHGPYGGVGGYFFEASPPHQDCYLGWISGRAYVRLDSITFHWRCPSQDKKHGVEIQEPFENSIFDATDKERRDEMLTNLRSSSQATSLTFTTIFACVLFSSISSLI